MDNNCECKKCSFATKREVKPRRAKILGILQQVNKNLKEKPRFCITFTGSSKNNAVYKHKHTDFDIDVELRFQGKLVESMSPSDQVKLRQKVYDALKSLGFAAKQSTSVISLVTKESWNYDLAVIIVNKDFDAKIILDKKVQINKRRLHKPGK